MLFPDYRPRRLRQSENLRRMIRETSLSVDDLILPLFVVAGKDVKSPIPSMPGHFHLSIDNFLKTARQAFDLGIPAIIIFGVPEKKDALGTQAYAENGIVQKAARAVKEKLPDLVAVTDVCLCQYTDHGHCGVVDGNTIDNDASLDLIARTALSHAKAGADMVAPSDMMDGRVGAIRDLLDDNGFVNTSILAYSAKYASAYYGPFRDACDSAPQGDRKTYQMDPRNAREGLFEAILDVQEGADMVMVKPALAYLDIIRQVRDEVLCPVVCYNVSGEYSLVKNAAAAGLVDEATIVRENLMAMRRAGSDLIITYHGRDALREGWIR
jgi:porphobilinogen synthase